VYGPDADKKNVDISVPLNPITIYGVTKHFMENMGNYYFHKYNVDFRSLRYPGIIAAKKFSPQGTTDYATEIFFSAMSEKEYTIPLSPYRVLPFVQVDDIVEGTLALMKIDSNILTSRVYNVNALSFSCEELTAEIKNKFPGFKYNYEPDFREEIAKTWPETLNDTLARQDWKWSPKYVDVKSILEYMTCNIKI